MASTKQGKDQTMVMGDGNTLYTGQMFCINSPQFVLDLARSKDWCSPVWHEGMSALDDLVVGLAVVP